MEGFDPRCWHQHVLAQSKGNLASAASLSYHTIKRHDGTIGVEWLGSCQYTAADLMGGHTDDNSAVAEAEYVLYSILGYFKSLVEAGPTTCPCLTAQFQINRNVATSFLTVSGRIGFFRLESRSRLSIYACMSDVVTLCMGFAFLRCPSSWAI